MQPFFQEVLSMYIRHTRKYGFVTQSYKIVKMLAWTILFHFLKRLGNHLKMS